MTRPRFDHELKCVAPYYFHVRHAGKGFEVRKDDRPGGFQINQLVALRLYAPNGEVSPLGVEKLDYLGPWFLVRITYVLRNFEGLAPGYCAFGFEKLHEAST